MIEGGEITEERKLIDYIEEPYRQDFLDLKQSLLKVQEEHKRMISKFLETPHKLILHKDMSELFRALHLTYIHMGNLSSDLGIMYGLYFKEKNT